MKTIGVKPNQYLLIRAYYWIYWSAAHPHRLTGLDQFIEAWIHEIDGGMMGNNVEQQQLEKDDDDDEEEGDHCPTHHQDLATCFRNCHSEKNQSVKMVVPTEEMLQAHHVQAIKWSNRFYFAGVAPATIW